MYFLAEERTTLKKVGRDNFLKKNRRKKTEQICATDSFLYNMTCNERNVFAECTVNVLWTCSSIHEVEAVSPSR